MNASEGRVIGCDFLVEVQLGCCSVGPMMLAEFEDGDRGIIAAGFDGEGEEESTSDQRCR